jgi:hypothetical protein
LFLFKIMANLETYIGFNPKKIETFFAERENWPVLYLPVQQLELVPVNQGAALECGDGRFDKLENREMRGPRVLGGVNVVMAMRTGGGTVGFHRAVQQLALHGATSGTHNDCGYEHLWEASRLASARYAFEPIVENLLDGEKLGVRLKAKTKWRSYRRRC